MAKKVKKKAGRPSKYKPAYAKQARKLCLLGATDDDLADFFGVTDTTIDTWKKKHPEFLASLKEAKKEANAKVVKSLFQRACGYEHEAVHFSAYEGDVTETPYIKHYPPDTTACIFWLKNRDRENWRDRQQHEHTGADGELIQIIVFGKHHK